MRTVTIVKTVGKNAKKFFGKLLLKINEGLSGMSNLMLNAARQNEGKLSETQKKLEEEQQNLNKNPQNEIYKAKQFRISNRTAFNPIPNQKVSFKTNEQRNKDMEQDEQELV